MFNLDTSPSFGRQHWQETLEEPFFVQFDMCSGKIRKKCSCFILVRISEKPAIDWSSQCFSQLQLTDGEIWLRDCDNHFRFSEMPKDSCYINDLPSNSPHHSSNSVLPRTRRRTSVKVYQISKQKHKFKGHFNVLVNCILFYWIKPRVFIMR